MAPYGHSTLLAISLPNRNQLAFFLPICTKPIMQLDSNPEPLSSLNIYIYMYIQQVLSNIPLSSENQQILFRARTSISNS